MKRVLTAIIWFSVLVCVAFSAGAAELKQVLILNFPGDGYKMLQAQQVIAALKEAGFVENEQIAISIAQPKSSEEAVAKVNEMTPDVVIDLSSTNQVSDRMFGAATPIIFEHGVEAYLDEQNFPKGNFNGIVVLYKDIVYNSYKFLQKVAPLKPGQSVVFLENTRANIITKEAAADALQRLGIPLKTVIDATVYEDWEAAVRQYNDDPEVGWILMGVWPTIRRDGSTPDMEKEIAPWQREFLKKPVVTYWEIAVQWAVLCGFGLDLNDIGRQCGEMAARVLNGEDIKTIKAEYPRKVSISLNRKTADTMGILFPQDVLSLANVIYHDWEGKEVTRKSGLK